MYKERVVAILVHRRSYGKQQKPSVTLRNDRWNRNLQNSKQVCQSLNLETRALYFGPCLEYEISFKPWLLLTTYSCVENMV
jgi:hypothetical protein